MEKGPIGTLWDFLNIHSVAKYQKKNYGGTLWSNKNIFEKNEKFEQSHSAQKRKKSHSVEKSGKRDQVHI